MNWPTTGFHILDLGYRYRLLSGDWLWPAQTCNRPRQTLVDAELTVSERGDGNVSITAVGALTDKGFGVALRLILFLRACFARAGLDLLAHRSPSLVE